MKRILRKGNPIARLVALWVVFVMVLVPLLENAGPLKKVKAEPAVLEYNLELPLTTYATDANLDNHYIEKTTVESVDYYGISGDSTVHNMIYPTGQYNAASVTASITPVTLSYDTYDNITYQTGAMVCTSNPDSTLDGSTSLSPVGTALNVPKDSIYAVYVKIDQFSDGTNTFGANNKWHLLAAYKLVQELHIPAWYSTDGDSAEKVTIAKEAYLPKYGDVSGKDKYMAEVEYYYASGTETDPGEYTDPATQMIDITSTRKLTGVPDGDYVGFVKYVFDNDSEYTATGKAIEIDATEPVLNGTPIIREHFGEYTEITEVNGVRYLQMGKDYRLTFKVTEDNPYAKNSTKILVVKFYDVDGNYVDEFEINAPNNPYNEYAMPYRVNNSGSFVPSGLVEGTYDVKVQLRDMANNGKEVQLARIQIVDTSLKVTKQDGTAVSTPAAADPTKEAYTVDVKISSGYQLYSIDIMDGSNVLNWEDTAKNLSGVTKGVNGLYTTTYSYTIPQDLSKDVLYEDLKIVVTDGRPAGSDPNNPANKVTVDLGKYDYDITPPEMESRMLSLNDTTNHNLADGVVYLDSDTTISSLVAKIKLKETHCNHEILLAIKNGKTNSTSEVVVPIDNSEANTYIADLKSYITEENTLYTISAYLEDSVGNKANNGNYVEVGSVKIMNKDLRVVSATLNDSTETWDVLNVIAPDKAFKNSPSNKIHTFKLKIESGYPFAQDSVVIRDKDGNTLDGGRFDLRQIEPVDGIYGGEITYTFPTPSNNDVKLEGIYVEIKDTNPDANKNIKPIYLGGFIYDKTAPDLVALGIYKANADGTYTEIKNKDLSNGEYIVDTTLDETFVVVYGAKDATTSVVEYDYYFTNSEASKIDQLKKPAVDSKINDISNEYDEYYIEYNTADLVQLITSKNTNKVTFYAKVVDEATNPTALVPATYTMVIPDNGLTVTATLTDQNGNIIDLSKINDGSYVANKKLELHVKAVSGYEITTMELLTDSTVYSTTPVTSTYDANNKKYTVEQTLAIPTDITSNQLLKAIQLRVTDTGNPAKTISVGQLLFDMSAPTINKADGSALAEDSTWYQSYNLAIAIKAGAQSVESEIDNVKYSIGNSYGDKIDVSDGVNYSGAAANLTIDVPESYTAAGTKINVSVTDKATNSNTAVASIKVDKTNPVVDELTVNGNAYNSIPLSSSVVVKTTASDNLALAKVSMVVESEDGTKRYPKDFEYDTLAAVSDDGSRVIRNEELSLSNLADGEYNVTVTAYDKSGRISSVKTTSFSVDSTKPVVTVKIAEGTKGGKQSSTNFDGTARDYYYSSNVGLELTYTEINLEEVVVTDNGSKVSLDWTYDSATCKHVASYKATSEGLHQVIISAKDKTGNEAESKTIYFVKDTSAPTITAIVNGAINYTDSTGSLIFTNDSSVAYSVSDANEDKEDFNYQLIKNVPDEPVSTGDYVKTAVRTFTYTEEADYTINVFSIDMASNKSATKTVSFRLDKTAPNISIGGIGDGGSSSNPVTVSLNMQELFWSDATGTVEIYMKSGEGFGEELIEEITYTPTGRNTAISRTFSESGIYRIVFNAQDNAGHTATAESAFTIDTEAPVVTLEGVTNFDVTDKDVVISSTITEKFYASKKVTITGTVTDDTGKVTPIVIDDYSATANPTVINHTFSDDGIYDLTISCVDIVGNTDSKTVHFTIDKTKPVIGDLSDYDGKILTSFEWDKDLDELVSDLTVCDVHMYLNGQEYNGEDAVEDGSYVLLITAEDELGHKVEKSVEFVLDTKSPVFIVTGVEDKEKKLEPYNISVSLQLEEDTLTSVTLNGKVVTITNNVATINVAEVGEYKLYMEAVDEAGNVSSAEYEFELISEKEFNFWIIIGIAALLLLIILFIILGKRKKDKE